MDFDDFPPQTLLVVGILIVSAIRWFFNQLQEKSAQREFERKQAEQRALARGEGPGTKPPLRQEADPLKELFEALGNPQQQQQQQPPQQQRPPQQQQRPPELPKPRVKREAARQQQKPSQQQAAKSSEPKRPVLSAEEKRALENLQSGLGAPIGKRQRKKRSRSGGAVGDLSITQLLRSQNAAQNAILLAEILGRPKGYAEQGTSSAAAWDK